MPLSIFTFRYISSTLTLFNILSYCKNYVTLNICYCFNTTLPFLRPQTLKIHNLLSIALHFVVIAKKEAKLAMKHIYLI